MSHSNGETVDSARKRLWTGKVTGRVRGNQTAVVKIPGGRSTRKTYLP